MQKLNRTFLGQTRIFQLIFREFVKLRYNFDFILSDFVKICKMKG